MENSVVKKKEGFFGRRYSIPLLKQTLKSNWVLWLVMALGTAFIFIIVNFALGTRQVFTNIDMNNVSIYVKDENMNWLQILGLLENMGFSLTRIQTMSQMDLNAVMADLIYKVTGVLLPMIYIMITANALIAAQVNDGSMAYILATPTNRKKVVRTQLLYLILAVISMYVIILTGCLISEGIALIIKNANLAEGAAKATWNVARPVLFVLGSMVSIFALAGIAFGASCYFNKSQKSIAVGGGVCVVSFICCILGLFGCPAFVALGVGVEAMYFFNYLSVFTLIDTDSMSATAKYWYHEPEAVANWNWAWKLGILVAIGVVFIVIGYRKFIKKDLPL